MMRAGWRKVRLGDVATVIVSNVDKKINEGEHPVRLCNYTDVYKRATINPRQDFMAATATLAEIEKYNLKVGDVIITKDSETADDIAAPTYVAETADDLVCGYHLAIIRPGQKIDGEFLKYYFELPHTRHYFGSRSSGITRFGLTIDGIKGATIQLPPLTEQRKIAETLRTWDYTIETTELLHATVQKRKRGLIQALLTGKYRFPEFKNQPWRTTRLGYLGSFRKGKGLSKSKVSPTGALPCVLYGELYTTYGEVIQEPVSHTDLNDGLISRAGDILIPASTTTTGVDLAIASCILCDNVRLGGDINVFRRSKNDIDSAFLAYFLTHARRHEIAALAQGLTIVHLKGSDLLNIKISVPPIGEQHRIVDVCSSVEREIETLSATIEQLRIGKKALIQQLLTSPRSNRSTCNEIHLC